MIVRTSPKPPDGFRETFIAHGWRGLERVFGNRTDVLLRWIEECGGLEQLKAERREYRRERYEAEKARMAAPMRRTA